MVLGLAGQPQLNNSFAGAREESREASTSKQHQSSMRVEGFRDGNLTCLRPHFA